jgi:surface protein
MSFNADLSLWNVGQVTTMAQMVSLRVVYWTTKAFLFMHYPVFSLYSLHHAARSALTCQRGTYPTSTT